MACTDLHEVDVRLEGRVDEEQVDVVELEPLQRGQQSLRKGGPTLKTRRNPDLWAAHRTHVAGLTAGPCARLTLRTPGRLSYTCVLPHATQRTLNAPAGPNAAIDLCVSRMDSPSISTPHAHPSLLLVNPPPLTLVVTKSSLRGVPVSAR